MPIHAKVLTVMLAINAVLAVVPLVEMHDTMSIVRAVIPALLLYGFLRGSEGVRVLLMIGAVIGLLGGAIGEIGASALLASTSLGWIATMAVVLSVWGLIANGYMLFALRNADVEQWMLQRSLGMSPD